MHTFHLKKEKKREYQKQFKVILEDGAINEERGTTKYIKFKKRLSPLRYPGGKSKMIDVIYDELENKNFVTFVEPFAGGASVGLAYLEAGCTEELIINDLEYGIYSLFYIILEDPATLKKLILDAELTSTMYKKMQRLILNGYKQEQSQILCTPLDAAFAFLLVNRTAFSGIIKANSISAIYSRWNPIALCKKIDKIFEMRKHIHVKNIDALQIIEEFYWQDNSVIFIDPPYYIKGNALYYTTFSEEQHENLCFLLESLYHGMPGAQIILYYDHCKEVVSMLQQPFFKTPNFEIIGRNYSCKKVGKRTIK